MVTAAEATGVATERRSLFSGWNSDRPRRSLSPVLPEDVRYKLKDAGAHLEDAEMESLIRSGFFREFFYLGAKALAGQPEQQRQYLQEVLAFFLAHSHKEPDFAEELDQLRQKYLHNIEVPAAKLAQISRRGFEEWRADLGGLVVRCLEKDPEALPVLITHVPLYALPDYVPLYRQAGQDVIYILADKWLSDPNNDYAGYKIDITVNPPQVRLMYKEETSELQGKKLFLVDDTVKSGNTFRGVEDFLVDRAQVRREDMHREFVTQIRSISTSAAVPTESNVSGVTLGHKLRRWLRNEH